jgi:NAD(P)-dependent dehydrogenase (short-subunit alcohol dehydrogenase family)
MSRWTENDMPDLGGKLALVTGANSGLGLETARGLAAKGAQVLLACRGADKAQRAIDDIRAKLPSAKLEFIPLDLSDLGSVRRCAERFKATHQRLDILCNNAGVMSLPYGKTADGFEMLFGTNHLGHFALTGLLLETILRTPKSRVVTVASIAHKVGRIDLEDPHWTRRSYSKRGAYGQAKLANLMFALDLERRLRRSGCDAISVAAHPGYSATNIAFGAPGAKTSLFGRMVVLGNALLAQPAHLGALPSLYAATSADIRGGDYIGPSGPLEFRGHPVRVHPRASARDEAMAAQLWKASEQMTGVHYLSHAQGH